MNLVIVLVSAVALAFLGFVGWAFWHASEETARLEAEDHRKIGRPGLAEEPQEPSEGLPPP